MRSRITAGIVGSLLSFCLLACCCPGPSGSSRTEAKLEKPKEDLAGILADFHANQESATKLYKGRRVTAVATVQSADWFDKKSKGPHAVLRVENPAMRNRVLKPLPDNSE